MPGPGRRPCTQAAVPQGLEVAVWAWVEQTPMRRHRTTSHRPSRRYRSFQLPHSARCGLTATCVGSLHPVLRGPNRGRLSTTNSQAQPNKTVLRIANHMKTARASSRASHAAAQQVVIVPATGEAAFREPVDSRSNVFSAKVNNKCSPRCMLNDARTTTTRRGCGVTSPRAGLNPHGRTYASRLKDTGT